MLLRKMWESIVPGNSSSNRNSAARVTTGIGSLDVLPEDVLGIILRKLGPEDAGKLCVVCRSWRRIVISDNRLWINFFQTNPNNLWDLDSIFFSETHLPRQLSVSVPVSLMHLYGQRAKVPGAVIVDGGSGYCKFGWSKYPRPSGRSATFLEFGNIEAPMYSRLRHFYATIYSRFFSSFTICFCTYTISEFGNIEAPTCKIHPVFHISQLKRAVGDDLVSPNIPEQFNKEFELVVEPEAIMEVKRTTANHGGGLGVLVKWKGLPIFEATWKDGEALSQRFPDFFLLEDKVSLLGRGIVTDPSSPSLNAGQPPIRAMQGGGKSIKNNNNQGLQQRTIPCL